MPSSLPDDLCHLIREVFRPLYPISDEDLCPGGFAPVHSANQVLRIFRGCDRFQLVGASIYLDSEAIVRMSGYARWYFAPTFMLRASVENLLSDYTELLNVFKYSSTILGDAGMDECCELDDEALTGAIVDPTALIQDFSLAECLPRRARLTSDLSLQHFCQSACFFSSVEKSGDGISALA